jgi:hypothetical protein
MRALRTSTKEAKKRERMAGRRSSWGLLMSSGRRMMPDAISD